MWTSSTTTLPSRWCSKQAPSEHHRIYQDVTSPQSATNSSSGNMAILDRRQSTKRHHQRLTRRHQQNRSSAKSLPPIEPEHLNARTTIPTNIELQAINICSCQNDLFCSSSTKYCPVAGTNQSYNTRHSIRSTEFVDGQGVDCGFSDTGPLEPVCDIFLTDCVDEEVALSGGLSRWTRCMRVVEAGWYFLLGVVLVLQGVFMTGVRRFLARFSGRRRWHFPPLPQHKSSLWRILALIIVYTSLINIVDGCSSRNTPKPRPPPTPATAAATTARPNITFLTYECPPAYAAWYCLNGATCFTVKIGDSLLYNCECSEGYMGPRCEYKDLDGSYLPSQRRILLETASIAGGATIAVLLVVVLGLVAYVHYCRRQRKEEPPTPPPQLTAAQSTLTTTTDTVDGATRTVTTSSCNTQVPRRLPTFGTRWKTQNQQPPNQHCASMTRVDLQQVTTLLGDCELAPAQQRQC